MFMARPTRKYPEDSRQKNHIMICCSTKPYGQVMLRNSLQVSIHQVLLITALNDGKNSNLYTNGLSMNWVNIII
jgi:hypothetical protein